MSTILIENGAIVTVNDNDEIHSPGYVWVENDRIAAVGAGSPPEELRTRAETVINANLMAVMPGMVNAHTHLFQTFLRGLADDKPLLQWLESAIWPVARVLQKEEAYLSGMLGMVENVRSGCTAVNDHHYVHTEPANDDAIFRAAEEAGLRFMMARGWADMNYHEAFKETPDHIVKEMARLRETWHGKHQNRLRLQFGPLIPWGCSDETMTRTFLLAKEWGMGTHIHVAESRAEVQIDLDKRGLRHVEWLDSLGALDSSVQLVHSVWLSDEELRMIAQHGAIVVHCPVANMYLASGVARIPEMLDLGISVALGTDGPGSNNSQDMMEVLKTTALLQKVHTLNAMILLPEDVLRMACRGGAEAFGLPNDIGSLEVGKKADITLVDLNTPFAMPVHRVPSALVYNINAREVDTVIVNGKILMRHKKILFVDEDALLREARSACAGLFKRAGVEINEQ
ncbi:MAG: amidohydrolase [Chloroflexi bacterium]|nr:MAG: amidohydrolase [Chloroflexota bacterium]